MLPTTARTLSSLARRASSARARAHSGPSADAKAFSSSRITGVIGPPRSRLSVETQPMTRSPSQMDA